MLFYILLGALALYVLGEFVSAYRDGYAFDWQICQHRADYEKRLSFSDHWGMWGDFLIINPIIAYVVNTHAHSWSLTGFAILFAVAAFLGAALLIPLLTDSDEVPSSLARDGLLPLAGAMHYLYFTVGTAVLASYYLLSPPADVSAKEVVFVTVCVAVHWSIGVLQPPLKVHGKIHGPAMLSTGAVLIALVALAWRLISLA